MSETNAETNAENNVDVREKEEATPRRGKRTSSIASTLAKEAEAILKGFGDKEDAPEGRRTTRSSTRGSVAPPTCTPPPAKKERKSSANINNTPGSRRGRPKRGTGDDVKPNSDEQKEEETNNVEETVEADDVEMKKAGDSNANGDGDDAKDQVGVKDAKPETKSEESTIESGASQGGDDEKSSDANASSSVPSSCANAPSTGSMPLSASTVAAGPTSTSNASAASVTTTANTTTTNGTVENACERINQDDKILTDSTGTNIKSEEVAKVTSPTANDEKAVTAAAAAAVASTGENTICDESNKSANNTSEPTANQSSITLSSND